MSNVLERFRGISEMEFYQNAIKIRHEMSHFLMSEKNMPKRWRSVYAYPIINKVQEMIDTIIDANRIVAYSPELLNDRKQGFQDAIELTDKIFERLQGAVQDVWWDMLHSEPGNPGYQNRLRIEKHVAEIGVLLEYEERLLKGCKYKSKLVKRK